MATPDTSPFRSENVTTLVINGASDGSRKPLSPSSSPSVPPTARPSIGFVKLISCVSEQARNLARGRRYAGWGRAITLRGVADDQSNDATRQDDSEIIVVHIEGNEQSKQKSQENSEQKAHR